MVIIAALNKSHREETGVSGLFRQGMRNIRRKLDAKEFPKPKPKEWLAREQRRKLCERPSAGRVRAEGEAMSKEKRSAEQQVADEADRRALNPLATRQTIADSQAAPSFRENHKRLKAERIAREAELKAKVK